MTLHSLSTQILETTLHQQDPRLKVERLWIAFPNRRIATTMEPIPLLKGSATAVAFANPLASQGSFYHLDILTGFKP